MSDNTNSGTDVNPPIDRRIERHISGLGLERGVSEEQVSEMINAAIGELDTGVGNGPPGDTSGLESRVDQELQRVRLASDPNHVAHVPTGEHQDQSFHPYGAWGTIVSADQAVHWRSADVYAESQGTTRLEIIEMDYTEAETYNLGKTHATRQLQLDGGLETVYPEVTIPEGTFFITRDSENPTEDVVGLKRVARDVDWQALNESHDIPIRFRASWQIGRQPGTDAFTQYRDSGWQNLLHYYARPEFGYLDETEV